MMLIDVMKKYREDHSSSNIFEIFKDYELDERLDKNALNVFMLDELGETTTVEIDQDMDTTTAGTNTDSYTRSTTDGDEETRKVSAFDESTFQNDSQRISSGTGSVTHSGTKTDSGSKNEDLTWRETDETVRAGYKDRDVQDALEKERKLNRFNVYQWIVKKYKEDMMVLIY